MRDYPVVTDAHAHVKTKAEALERIREGIPTMVCGTDPEDARWVMELCQKPEAEGILFPVFGLHPWYADQWNVEDMMPYLEKCQVIGEIGMDSLWCNVPLKRQKEVLEKQLQIAAEWKKPVVLHTKDQEREILELIRKYPNTYLVHWYSADHDLDGYLDLECYFSVGPDVIWNPAVQQVAKRVPENRILLETDGMDAVKWAWEEGQKSQNYAIEERESIWEAAEDQTKEISVSDSLYATACMVSKLRNILTETLINLTSDNFFAFWWNSYGNRLTNK